MTEAGLVYFADPMCSWCWGFAPVIETIVEAWGDTLPIRLVMGGLRPGETTAMSDEARATLRGHWRHVTEASGQSFGPAALAQPGFIYDTDPAARAVVLVRAHAPGQEIAFLHALQRAFYLEGRDITDVAILAGLAQGFGLNEDDFAADLLKPEIKRDAWRDYAISQGAGVTGFPTLILGPGADGAYQPITRGFQAAAKVLPIIVSLLGVSGDVAQTK